jgi:hypothetical protein
LRSWVKGTMELSVAKTEFNHKVTEAWPDNSKASLEATEATVERLKVDSIRSLEDRHLVVWRHGQRKKGIRGNSGGVWLMLAITQGRKICCAVPAVRKGYICKGPGLAAKKPPMPGCLWSVDRLVIMDYATTIQGSSHSWWWRDHLTVFRKTLEVKREIGSMTGLREMSNRRQICDWAVRN